MPLIRGTTGAERLDGSSSDDQIFAFAGNDIVTAGAGNDRVLGDDGNDLIDGGAGDDALYGDNGNDTLDGGAGNDRLYGGRGDDLGIFRLSENLTARDYLDGGEGFDILRLVLTRAEADAAGVRADIAAFRTFLAVSARPDTATNPVFQFNALPLQARNWEALEVVITDPTPPPTLAIDDPSVVEGNPGEPGTTISFTVRRSGDASAPVSVRYLVTPGSALTPDDYVAGANALSGLLTFGPGESSRLISLDVTEDRVPEPTELFIVALSDATGATLGKAVGTGTIVDDDLPALAVADAFATEGDPGGPDATISFSITRSGDNGIASSVDYTVVPGSAGMPADYNGSLAALAGSVSFGPGESVRTVTLDLTDDLIAEPTESFGMVLSNPVNATLVQASASGTIVDDDLPQLAIDSASATEGDPLGVDAQITFTVTRSGDNGVATQVNYAVQPGTARTPQDYAAGGAPLTGMLTFAPGETTKTISLDVTDDDVAEPTESFTVVLSGVVNGELAAAQGLGTILDNDLPQLAVADATAAEGDPGGIDSTISFSITRSGDNGLPSSVHYEVLPGSALAPDDYDGSLDALSGTLTFLPGETSKTLTLNLTDDFVAEPTETFRVVLSAPVNAAIVHSEATGTITDGDAASLAIEDASATEGDPGGPDASIVFVVRRSGSSAGIATVGYSVMPGSATQPGDYNGSLAPLSGTLTFLPGQTEQTITIDVTDDLIGETTETFSVVLDAPVGASIARGTATGTIFDNERTISIGDASASEGGTLEFPVSLSSADPLHDSSATYEVRFRNPHVGNATAADLEPTALLTGTVFIPAGSTTPVEPIRLGAFDDALFEGAEGFEVVLIGLSSNLAPGDTQATGTIVDNDDGGTDEGYTWGDPHYVTFDGLHYDFQGVGEFTLVKATSGDPLIVQSRTVPAWSNWVSMNSAIATLVDGRRVTIDTAQAQPLRVDGVVTSVDPLTGRLAIGAGELTFSGNVYVINYPNGEQVVVTDYGSSIDVCVSVLKTRSPGTLQGLLGNHDGNAANDVALRDGTALGLSWSPTTLYGRYGSRTEGWRISQAESLFDYGAGQGTDSFSNLSFPGFALTLAMLPRALVLEAEALLDLYGITDPRLRESGILDYAITGNANFIAGLVGVAVPVNGGALVDAQIVWNGGGTLVLGTAAARASFSVGSNTATPAGVTWSGADASDSWGVGANWVGGVAPGAASTAVFASAGAGTNVVDADRQIGALHYSGGGNHVTRLLDGTRLDVAGASAIQLANSAQRSMLAIADGLRVEAHLDELNVGIVATGSGSATGILYVGGTGVLDAGDVGVLSVGRETGSSGGNVSAASGSLTLASNSTLVLGTQTTPAVLNIGYSQNSNVSFGSGGSATGVLDALDSAAMLDWHLSELNVGRGSFNGAGNGTLKWDQSEVITAPNVYFGRGYASGSLVVPAGGQFLLGTAGAPIDALRIAYNDAGRGTASATLDFSVTDPTFTAYIGAELSIGRETGSSGGNVSAASGSLTLASNSTLVLGTQTTPAVLNIGYSQNSNVSFGSGGSATGVLDAFQGTLTTHITTLNLGVTANRGGASGEFRVGDGVTLTATSVNVGVGSGATGKLAFDPSFDGSFIANTVALHQGNFDFAANTLDIGGSGAIVAQTFNLGGGTLSGATVDLNAGGAFNFSSGRLAVSTFNGLLNQNGGRLAPGDSTVGATTVNGNFNLAAAGTLEVGLTDLGHDLLAVNGVVDLNGAGVTGGGLDLLLAYAPQLTDAFTIIQNDGVDAVLATFAGPAESGSISRSFGGNNYTFVISYIGGDGNDVVLTVSAITPLLGLLPEPPVEAEAASTATEIELIGLASLSVMLPASWAEP